MQRKNWKWMNDTKMTMLYARHLPFHTGLIMKYQFLLTHDSHKQKADFPHLQAQSLRCLIERYPLWTVPDLFYAVNTTVKFMLLCKKILSRWIVPVWKADATSCDCLCLSRSEISYCLCFKVYISVLYRSSFFHRSVFLQKKRCEALSAFFYFISFPLPL